MTFANETPLERAQRELRNAKVALARVQATLVAAGALPPDEHGLESASVMAYHMCNAIDRLATSADPAHIWGSVSTPGYTGPSIPTRACPQCDGKGMLNVQHVAESNFWAKPRECNRCGGSGRVVAT